MAHIPYGYRVEAGIAVIEENEANEIKALFNNYLECKSIRKAGFIVGIDKPHSAMGKILRNSIYLGEDFYPQIIDEETFSMVQDLRFKNAVDQNRIKVRDCSQSTIIIKNYKATKVTRKYKDPFKQAEYAYSQIKEV